jgi:hypothetical protein
MIKTINLEEAVGTQLAHDITEIRPEELKGPAFARVTPFAMKISAVSSVWGNVIDLADKIHENEAAAILAGALAKEGIAWENSRPLFSPVQLLHG